MGTPPRPEDVAFAHHERTRHHPRRYAASPPPLDRATQPDAFRRYRGAPLLRLPLPLEEAPLPYWALYVPGGVAGAGA